MFFIYCIKNLISSNPNEESSEDQESENNNFFSLSNIYKLFDSFKIKLSDIFSLVNKKILVIRLMIFFAFFFFLFLFIKSIKKAESNFINRNHKIIQRNYNPTKLSNLQSGRLINKNNIKIKKHLNISLNLEHSNYVHLLIDSMKANRWKVPTEILNNEYFDTMNEKNSKKNINFEI